MHQSLTGHLMHFIYLTVFSNYGRWYTTNLNFPFSIFHTLGRFYSRIYKTVFTNWERRLAAI